jgi:hypothetical protein
MKTSFLTIFAIIMFLFPFKSQAQLEIDAGEDMIVCNNWYIADTVILGGNPSANGGTAPYTYAWHREPSYIFGHTASYFLNDTTIANPQLINPGAPFTLYLTVTDNTGNSAKDSVYIDFYNYDVILGYMEYDIMQGDSIFLSGWGGPGGGGTPPYTFVWRPNEGLEDSTSLSFWAKPSYSVAYYISQIDANDCEFSHPASYHISVIPSGNNEIQSNETFSISPNPTQNTISIKSDKKRSDDLRYIIYNSDGKLVLTTTSNKENLTIDLQNLKNGTYILHILKNESVIFSDKLIKQ